MVRSETIALNDHLRTTFAGGKVRVEPSPYQLDARLCGRALFVMSRQRRFAPDSDHDLGRFVFAGYLFEWSIDEAIPTYPHLTRATRVLSLRVLDDRLIR